MAKLTVSYPQNWVFSKDRKVRRDWIAEIDTPEKVEVAEENSDKYDFDSIFYSVGYCRQRNFFYTVGPKLLNLEALVLPIQARYSIDDGKTFTPLEYTVLNNSVSFNNTIINFETMGLPDGLVQLDLRLACGDTKSFYFDNQPKQATAIVLNTHQKDNNVEWIVDWLNYYASMGVFEFHIYDNGSANFDAVCQSLETQVSSKVSITITAWHYRFGISQFSNSEFSQTSSILDCNYQNQSAEWLLNFDIDEYLVFDTKFESVLELLESFGSEKANIRFGCSDAPLLREFDYPENISVRDLEWRSRTIRPKYKNAFRPKMTKSASVHWVKLNEENASVIPDASTCFYLHALPLNTGWRGSNRLTARNSLLSGRFVEEYRVSDRMKKIDCDS